jgi:hypothetical protein
MYIVWGNNISRARADAHPFTPLIEQASQARTTGAEMASTAISAQRQSGGLNATSRCRAQRNIKKQKRVLVSEARAQRELGSITRRETTMTNFKLISAAAILSAAIATPAFAQEAVQEPGLQAFYQSLGAGSQSSATASAMASTRSGPNASVPVKRISAKHHTSDHRM